MHRSLGAETDPADRCSAGKVFPFRPVVPVNREACGADHADGVGDGILRNVEDNLDATLARLKRLTSHETSMKPTTAHPTTSLRQMRMLLGPLFVSRRWCGIVKSRCDLSTFSKAERRTGAAATGGRRPQGLAVFGAHDL
jgi:hypothetical protein